MRIVVLALVLAASPCWASEPAPPRDVQLGNETYRLVTGADLEATLRGRTISDPAQCGRTTAGCTESSYADGRTYVHSGDRQPWISGTYEVLGEQYCMTIGQNKHCSALLKSDGGGYAVTNFWQG